MHSIVERLLGLLLLGSALASCARVPEEIALSGPTMGTVYSVRVAAPPPDLDSAALARLINGVLREVDEEMSGYRPDSLLARFNASQSVDWFAVSGRFATVLAAAQEVSAASNGAFDVTVAPLVAAWGFGPERPTDLAGDAPNSEDVAGLRDLIGYTQLHVRASPPAVRKDHPELKIDLNAIAPGFAVDRIVARLREAGAERFLVDVGGEVRAQGRNVRGEVWRVAVERPVEGPSTPYAVVRLDDCAVSTSGEYRTAYVREGRTYSHTIDPGAMQPIDHAPAAVVVIATDAMHADAWSTAYNVLGVERGYALAMQLNMAVMFIERRGDALAHRMTPAFERFVLWKAAS